MPTLMPTSISRCGWTSEAERSQCRWKRIAIYFLLGAYRYPKQDMETEKGHPFPDGDLEMVEVEEGEDMIDPPDPDMPSEEEGNVDG